MLLDYVFRYTLLITSTLNLYLSVYLLYVYMCLYDDQMYDTDRSGCISKEELASLLRVTN